MAAPWCAASSLPCSRSARSSSLVDNFTDLGDIALFVLAALALIPLAWLIGETTEHAAHHTGPGIGGFLNATFGNAPELIIALIALNTGLTEVVRGSLTGSVVGNLLLVLGFSLLFGGEGRLDRESSLISFALVAFAVALFLIPSIPGWEGDPDRHSLAVLSVPVSIALLVVYVVVTWYSLRRHRLMHVSDEAAAEAAWSLPLSLVVLSAATVVTALVAETLVHTLRPSPTRSGSPTSSSPPSSSRSSGTRPSTAAPSSSPTAGTSSSPQRSRSPRAPRWPSSSSRPWH